MDKFYVDYFLLIFLSACGVLQIPVSHSGLKGLMFFVRPRYSISVGIGMVLVAFLWFFLSTPRNLPDTGRGLDGIAQTGLFAAGAGAALVFTLILSSIINVSLCNGHRSYIVGLEALKETTYFQALSDTLRGLWKNSLK